MMDIGGMVKIFVAMGERKMWTKFKYWLIRKLGGYVAPCNKCNKYQKTLLQVNRHAEKLVGLVDINAHSWFDNAPEETRIEIGKSYVIEQMRKLLIDNDYIKYEYEDDGILRGTLMVVKQP